MKHLEMNSVSDCRALLDKIFFRIFLRDVPFRPGLENLRMFSRLRLILAFLALERHASNNVDDEDVVVVVLRAGRTVNAFKLG